MILYYQIDASFSEGVIDIDVRKALAPFLLRLRAEAAVRSAAIGGCIALPCATLLLIADRVFGAGGPVLRVIPALYGLLVLALYLLRYRPTLRTAAARLDALGQQDRVSTMVEFAGSDAVLSRMQREDAAAKLREIRPSQIRLRWPVRALAACGVLAALLAGVWLVPQSAINALPFARAPQESEEAALLRGRMEDMRAQVEASGMKEADMQNVLAQIDSLLAQLDAGSMDLAAIAQVQRLVEDVEGTVAELTPRDTYAAVLLEYERLAPLGEAIFKGNMDVVRLVLRNIEYTLTQMEGQEQVNALMALVYDVNASLAKPIRDASQENLRQAMMMMAGALESAAQLAYNGRDNRQMIETALFTVEEYIREFLGVPDTVERYDPFANMTPEPGPRRTSRPPAHVRATPEPVKLPAETEYVYDPPQSVLMGGYAPGEVDENGNMQRLPANEDKHRDGTVPYGKVYGEYYAKMLDELSAGAVPEDVREAVEAYFDGI